MANFVLMLLCLVLGVVLRVSGRLPDNAHQTLNGVIVNVALPALTLASIHRMSYDASLLYAVAMPWLVFAAGTVFFFGVARLLRLDRATTGGLVLTGALGNTSFVGLPMIETFYGRQALHVGLLIDQLGSYLVLSTLGIVLAAVCAGTSLSTRNVARRLVTFPPLIALGVAFLLVPVPFPGWLETVLGRLADTIAPLALLSVGSQLRLDSFARNRHTLSLGLTFKLVLAPLILAPFYLGLPAGLHDTARITLFEAAMAPMIGGGIVAMQHGLNPPLVSLMIGVGIPPHFPARLLDAIIADIAAAQAEV